MSVYGINTEETSLYYIKGVVVLQNYYEQAQETLQLLQSKNATYVTDAGNTVNLNFADTRKVILYPQGVIPDVTQVKPKHSKVETKCYLYNDDAFAVAKRCIKDKTRTAVLNFASAWCPGGGFLSGANAQEECLCRASTLYQSIGSKTAQVMYDTNHNSNSPLLTDYMLYTPTVTVFRDAFGRFLDYPFRCSVITAPAVDKRRLNLIQKPQADAEMYARCVKLLSIAVENRINNIVLGAWGCGVFGNAPITVAKMFYDVLYVQNYAKFFDTVCFAVYDTRPEKPLYTAFKQTFRNCL